MGIPVKQEGLTMYNGETKKRVKSQKETVLDMLKKAGSKGVTNDTLSKVTFRFATSIHLLYQEGYIISTENLGEGVCNYTLLKEPSSPRLEKDEKAIIVLNREIMTKYNDCISSSDLDEILDSLGFVIKRKQGFYSKKEL